MIQFKNILEKLMNDGVVGIKQSFEDEGVIFDDVVKMKRICDSVSAYISVKIGGCEAISDINNCLSLDVNGIVAPMIESEFALQKFVEAVITNIDIDKREKMKFYINVESKTAYENLDKILSSPSSKLLTGIVIGRSDLTKSFGYGKQDVVSNKMCKVVTDILTQSKNYGFKTLMGGNIGSSSINFIQDMFSKKLLNKFTLHKDNTYKAWVYCTNKNDYHEVWHDHKSTCSINSVYYLSIPNEEECQLKLEHNKNRFDFFPKENDFIIFPSYMMYGVPPNKTNRTRKALGVNALTKGTLGDKKTISEIIFGRYAK